ncbi:MAG: aminotransferase class I/II-fold pyridoxal phosphate-dependent enzyme, partial [Pseudomonadota bacterium]
MPKLSNRVANIIGDGSDGWGILYRARALQADGVEITNLTIGEHDIRTNDAILDEMHRAAKSGATGYAPVPGSKELRQAIADRVTQRSGVPTTRDQVLVTAGGQAALFAAHSAALDPGDAGAYITPGYATYDGTIRALACDPIVLAARSRNNFQPEAADLAPAAQAKSLLICTPCNPTGTVYSPETIQTICDFAKENDQWIISDEVYGTQVWDGTHISPRMIDGMSDNVMVIGSMSKSHAMTGSRVGWLIAPEDIVENLINQSTVTTYGLPGYIQAAALFGLKLGDAFEAQIAAPFRRRRDMAERMFSNDPHIRMIPCNIQRIMLRYQVQVGVTHAKTVDDHPYFERLING